MNASHPPFRLGDLIDGCSCGVLYIVLVLEKLPVNKKKERILFALFYKLLSPLLIGGSSNIHLLSRDQLLPTISQENHSACQVTFLLPENPSILTSDFYIYLCIAILCDVPTLHAWLLPFAPK